MFSHGQAKSRLHASSEQVTLPASGAWFLHTVTDQYLTCTVLRSNPERGVKVSRLAGNERCRKLKGSLVWKAHADACRHAIAKWAIVALGVCRKRMRRRQVTYPTT